MIPRNGSLPLMISLIMGVSDDSCFINEESQI